MAIESAQAAILDFVVGQSDGKRPLLREIANAVGLRSLSCVSHHLHRLEQAGVLRWKWRPKERADRFWSKVEKGDDCWRWNGRRNKAGYGVLVTYAGPHRGNQLAHRTAWELAHGPIPEGLRVCHHCDNPSCVRADHLFLGTVDDNNKDRDRKGRQFAPTAKRLQPLLAEIRTEKAAGLSQYEIARRHGVNQSQISRLLNGQ